MNAKMHRSKRDEHEVETELPDDPAILRAIARKLPYKVLASELGSRNAARSIGKSGRPKKLAPCRWCFKPFGYKDRIKHEPHCPSRLR